MNLTTTLAAIGAWAAEISAPQWVLIGLIAFLLAMLVVAAFEDYWFAIEAAFGERGVRREDVVTVHERTWPEYWQ